MRAVEKIIFSITNFLILIYNIFLLFLEFFTNGKNYRAHFKVYNKKIYLPLKLMRTDSSILLANCHIILSKYIL